MLEPRSESCVRGQARQELGPSPRAAASVQGPCRGRSLGVLDPKLPVLFPSLLPPSSLLFMLFQARGPERPLTRSVQARTGRGGERMWRDK